MSREDQMRAPHGTSEGAPGGPGTGDMAGTGGTGGAAGMPAMLNCSQAERPLQRYLDRELTPEEEAEVRMHLDFCENCRTRFRFEDHLRRLVQRSGRVEQAPAGLRERIRQLLGRPGASA